MVSEEEFIKSVIVLLYECKFSKKEWNEDSVGKIYQWLDLFQNKFLIPFKEYIKRDSSFDNNNENNNNNNNNIFQDNIYLNHVKKFWDDSIQEYSIQNKVPKLDIDFRDIINDSNNLKEYVFNLWINNLNITENKFSFFLNYHFNNLKLTNNNNSVNNSVNSVDNNINSLKDVYYNIKSLNQLNNNLKSIAGSKNSNIDTTPKSLIYNIESMLYKNDNIKKKASSQLILKHFIKIQQEQSVGQQELNKEIKDMLEKLLSDEATFNIYLWIILDILEKEIKRQHLNQPNQPISTLQPQPSGNDQIYFLIYSNSIDLVSKSKHAKKIKFFLKSDKDLLLEISKIDENFHKMYYESIFLLLDYYLFNSKSTTSIDPNYLASISASLKLLNQIDNKIQIQVNQRLLGTKFLKVSEASKEILLEFLINFKNSNSKTI
ncbi:hypothetical protein DICPUDRAFT_85263 [Dictyostelium purpureum]|uniref:Uncharacterized protein n=1 Tax=Dictyostelium purpureum TaxID=5786 RepID=F1A572_DICPU|nr:uncharacterized protein DICPUDRAFT_85263 [Dictyostelium purpureum]EGC28656.1 hypothetical protein DICPUDRAFT_85263 [Dictyostelium purpureum]|eukprot:XP_003294816.1 hypothetical protein DICPUDRAFT_85263 [Dictyostelium purpureum]